MLKKWTGWLKEISEKKTAQRHASAVEKTESVDDDAHIPLSQKQLSALLTQGDMSPVKEMIAEGVPICLAYLPEHLVAVFSTHILQFKENEDRPKHMCLLNKRHFCSSYAMAVSVYHESIHNKQRREDGYVSDYRCSRIKEMEAYGKATCKIVFDFVAGHIDETEFYRSHLNEEIRHVSLFLNAYYQQKTVTTPNDMLLALAKLRKTGFEKPLSHVMTSFYMLFAREKEEMANVTEIAIEQRNKTIHLIEKYREDIDNLGDISFRDFTEKEAYTLLNRDGLFPVDRLSTEDKKTFWNNICHVNKEQKSLLDEQEGRIQRLGL